MGEPFPLRTALVLGLGYLGISLVGPITNNFVPIFLRDMGLPATLIGFVMTWDNTINLLVQPAVGELSDRTRSRFGRRKPWILVGAPVAAAGLVAIPGMSSLAGVMAAILVANFALALFRSPAVSLLGDLVPAPQRSAANGVINLMGGIGAILAFGLGGWLYQSGRIYPFAFAGALMLATLLALVSLIREPQAPLHQGGEELGGGALGALREVVGSPDRSGARVLGALLCWTMGYSALEAWLSSFGKFGLGINEGRMAMVTAAMPLAFVLFAVPSGLLATRFGRRRVILGGLNGLTATLAYGAFVRNESMLLLFLLAAGIFWALINVNALPLVYDVGPADRVGAMTGLYYLAGSAALISAPPVVGALVDLSGGSYRVMFLFSAAFMLIARQLTSAVRAGRPSDPDAR